MTCPKCGWEQRSAALECERCGIVTGRFRAQARPTPGRVLQPPPVVPRRSAGAWKPWTGLAGGVLCAVVVVMVSRDQRRSPIESGAAPPVAPAIAQAPATPVASPSAEPRPAEVALAETGIEPPPTIAPATEVLPSLTCPLSTRGYGAPPSRDRVVSDWYTRADGYGLASREHLAAAAPMVVYFFTDWCQYCKAFERELLSTSTVDRYLRQQVVKMKINPETGDAEKRLAERFGVHGYPNLYVVVPGGETEELSPYADATRLMGPDAFVASIERRMKEHGGVLARQANADRQGRQFDRAIAGFTLALRINSEDDAAFLDRGRAYSESGAADDALDDFARFARAHPENLAPVQEADLVLGGRGDWDESIACWTSFLQANPANAAAYLGRSVALDKRGLKVLSRADAQTACRLGERKACARLSANAPPFRGAGG